MGSRTKTISESGDRRWMQIALALARRGLGNVWPNPAVGCVLVRDGRIVGRGWTQPGGRPHAETEALRRAGALARGATAYVTLEPCAHHGRTPPCSEALVAAGIARVVVATGDPDSRVAGRGLAQLRAFGIATETGLLEQQAREVNVGFFNRIERGCPLVSMKLATSLDARIATGSGASQWITGDLARARGHLLRARHDAILVGVGTVLADDPVLTCRLPGLAAASPVRVVLDSRGRIPPACRLLNGSDPAPVWLLSGAATVPEQLGEGVERISVRQAEDGHLALPEVMSVLAERGITRLLVEGGAKITTAFLRARMLDRLYWFRAPVAIGGDGLSAIAGLDAVALDDAAGFRLVDLERLGEDVLETYALRA